MAVQPFPFEALFAELQGEVMARMTSSAAVLLSFTCKAYWAHPALARARTSHGSFFLFLESVAVEEDDASIFRLLEQEFEWPYTGFWPGLLHRAAQARNFGFVDAITASSQEVVDIILESHSERRILEETAIFGDFGMYATLARRFIVKGVSPGIHLERALACATLHGHLDFLTAATEACPDAVKRLGTPASTIFRGELEFLALTSGDERVIAFWEGRGIADAPRLVGFSLQASELAALSPTDVPTFQRTLSRFGGVQHQAHIHFLFRALRHRRAADVAYMLREPLLPDTFAFLMGAFCTPEHADVFKLLLPWRAPGEFSEIYLPHIPPAGYVFVREHGILCDLRRFVPSLEQECAIATLRHSRVDLNVLQRMAFRCDPRFLTRCHALLLRGIVDTDDATSALHWGDTQGAVPWFMDHLGVTFAGIVAIVGGPLTRTVGADRTHSVRHAARTLFVAARTACRPGRARDPFFSEAMDAQRKQFVATLEALGRETHVGEDTHNLIDRLLVLVAKQ